MGRDRLEEAVGEVEGTPSCPTKESRRRPRRQESRFEFQKVGEVRARRRDWPFGDGGDVNRAVQRPSSPWPSLAFERLILPAIILAGLLQATADPGRNRHAH